MTRDRKVRSFPFLLLASAALILSSCTHAPTSGDSEKTGTPTVMNTRVEPPTVVLNSELQPNTPVQVFADVQGRGSPIVDARLKFSDVPIEIPMDNVGGTTWRAELTPQELRMLAVSGKTISYHANILARDAHGEISQPSEQVSVAVKSPSYEHQYASVRPNL